MTYYLNHSEWYSTKYIPEGMNVDMVNNDHRTQQLLMPAITKSAKDKVFIDLGCGTGMLGLHALKHGAKFVYFVEQDVQMCHILENVFKNKLDPDKYKIISKEITLLEESDFDKGVPEIVVSEFFGPGLFDEGYVHYTKQIRMIFPEIQFIPETFKIKLYLNKIDYTQPIWPKDSELLDHFKFMYKEKGFARMISVEENDLVGTIEFNANTRQFDDSVTFEYTKDEDLLLVGVANVEHEEFIQHFTVIGWFMSKDEKGKKFKIHIDTDNYFNPAKVEL